MRRITALVIALTAALGITLGAHAASQASQATKLTGVDGPGFTITLKQGSKKVTSLKAGAYTIVISDKSNIHNFHLKGPGLNKTTSVPKVGTTTWKVTLKKGKYTYVCDPHATTMKGSFTVK
jgi:plastocyanin